jgi:hypothetical protein
MLPPALFSQVFRCGLAPTSGARLRRLWSTWQLAAVPRLPDGDGDGREREDYASILVQGADGLLTKFAASSVLPLPLYLATCG